MTSMWQEERGKPIYRFQTDEIEINNKMKRRKNFSLVAWGINCDLWIYQTGFSRPDIARKVFKTLTGKVAILDKKKDVFTD